MDGLQTYLLYAGLLLIAMGLFSVKGNLVEILRTITASKWPCVDGEIEAAGVAEGHDYAGVNGSERVIFRVLVRYNYRVGSQTYTSEKAGLTGQIFTSFKSAQRAASRFTNGKSVKVHVSPDDPMRSMINMGSGWRYWLGLVVSAALSGVGCIMVLAHFGIYV